MNQISNDQNFKLSELKPLELADAPWVKEQFINVMMSIQGVDLNTAESVYSRETLYYKKALSASTKIQNCTNISLYSSFLEIAITGLSIQPGSKSEAFLESRGTNIGTKDKSNWVNSAVLQITAYGELNMRIKAGQIIRMSNPIVLYDGDHFQPFTTARGELSIDYKPAIPRKSNTIFGCWVAIYTPHGGIDFKWLLNDDIKRLRKASAKQNKGDSNALYSGNAGQIDPGFLEAKTIKHAMRSYTKLRVGEAVAFEEDIPAPGIEEETFAAENSNVPAQPDTVIITDNEEVF